MNPRLKSLAPWAVLCAVACAVFLLPHNSEFYRDEDYEYLYHAAAFAHFFHALPAAFTDFHEAIYRLTSGIHSLLFYRHGPLPAMYLGLFYAAAETLRLPMTVGMFQLPTAVMGVGTVLLFHHLLRRGGLTPGIAFAGALLLSLSPLLVALGRGVHTWTWVWIPFGQVLALVALQHLAQTGRSTLWAGLALANAMLGDGLFFLIPLAMGTAFALREQTWSLRQMRPTVLIKTLTAGAKPLLCLKVLNPIILVIATLGLSGMAVLILRDRLGDRFPLNSLALLALGKNDSAGGLNLDPMAWHHYATVALGEGAPLLALLVIVALLLGRMPIKGLLWAYSLIASLGYGLLVYVMIPYFPGSVETYQIYTLLPFALLVVLSLERLWRSAGALRTLAAAGTAISLTLAATSMLAFVWRCNTAIIPRLFASSDFGGNKPLFGTKAAGYVIRQTIESRLAQKPDQPITVTLWRTKGQGTTPLAPYGGFRNWSSPTLAFAGLSQKGDYFANRLKHPVSVTVDFPSDPVDIDAHYPLCTVDLCVQVDLGGTTLSTQSITSGGKGIAEISVLGEDNGAITHDAQDLALAFDATYHSLFDIFPDRPSWRRQELVLSLLRKIGAGAEPAS
ncbi:MAG: hypothetical protein JXQ84_00960 [Rhodospirillaceae bacterium]|nr:hypothetical protein [Rhodospirillaceae bacterium]